jgi:hypothetical protein
MSYISVNGAGSAYSNQQQQFISNGSTIPVAPATVVSGTEYTALTWTLQDGNVGNNGRGAYILNFTFDVVGDNTTAFTSILVQLNIGGALLWDSDVLIGTTLPDSNPYSFYIPFTYMFDENIGILTPTLSFILKPTFTGTAPTIPSAYASIYKIA